MLLASPQAALENVTAAVRFYRDSEIHRRVAGDLQMLVLQKAREKTSREITAFRQRGVSDELEPVSNPILGREAIELRAKDPAQADVRKWHLIEFGAPELIKRSALARFSLLNAYLKKSRKALAVKQANERPPVAGTSKRP
jgi:hypothetical protein